VCISRCLLWGPSPLSRTQVFDRCIHVLCSTARYSCWSLVRDVQRGVCGLVRSHKHTYLTPLAQRGQAMRVCPPRRLCGSTLDGGERGHRSQEKYPLTYLRGGRRHLLNFGGADRRTKADPNTKGCTLPQEFVHTFPINRSQSIDQPPSKHTACTPRFARLHEHPPNQSSRTNSKSKQPTSNQTQPNTNTHHTPKAITTRT
jgi:hypothetical protein